MKKLSIIAISAVISTMGMVQAAPRHSLSFIGKDYVMRRDTPPAPTESRDTAVTLWRGERGGVAALFVPVSPTGRLKVSIQPDGDHNLPDGFKPYFADYVITNDYRHCGWPPDALPTYEVADALVNSTASEAQAGAARPIWITLDVPHDAKPGEYPAIVVVEDLYRPTVPDTLHLTVNVLDRTLPLPHDQNFHLNMWQQPYAISRYYGLTPWSDEHFEAMRPYAQLLARAGQKMISTILIYEPWGEQSRDKFEPMIDTRLKSNGTWTYDYTVFDKWVQFMMDNGVDGGIECFSMIPWDLNYRYFDEAAGEYRTIHAKAGTKEYAAFWEPFLKSFAAHLKERGWWDKTIIAIDERQLPDMLAAYDVAQKAAPDIKMALHGNYHPELADKLQSYTLLVGESYPADVLADRNAKGWVSCLYTCCAGEEPNIFSNSEPADAAYLPVHCLANGTSGYLHWAFTNWTDNPMTDTRFYMFAPGDTYCAYPDGGSSVRFERMIEGIQLSEKARLLREQYQRDNNTVGIELIDEALAPLADSSRPVADRIRAYDSLERLIALLSRH